jgi:hypothetical protein
MSKPKRIQRSRSKGWKMPANAIYVGRPTVWGNPYMVGSKLMNGETLTAEKAVELRKGAFACGLIRSEGSRLTFGVLD